MSLKPVLHNRQTVSEAFKAPVVVGVLTPHAFAVHLLQFESHDAVNVVGVLPNTPYTI